MKSHKPLLVIKTGNTIASLKESGEDFEDWFVAGTGAEAFHCQIVSLFQDEPLPKVSGVGAIIVTGSPAYVTDADAWIRIGADYLRLAHEQGVPILGVCYGHQLLAWAFGGEVDFHPAGRHIGTAEVLLTEAGQQDALLGSLPGHFAAQVSHRQAVLKLPDEACLLASNAHDPNHAFRLGESTWGVQFHPEFDARITRAYITERRKEILAEGLDADALLSTVRETPQAASLLRRFAELAQL